MNIIFVENFQKTIHYTYRARKSLGILINDVRLVRVRNGEPSVSEKRKSKQIPRKRKSEDKFENITKNPTRLKGPARFGEVLNH
ncbi:hypothetical protein T08_7552 [Trichinella sp. T8]|nr:hypothetical protein T08_7552 [Trichinella sp. T8]